MIPGAPTVSLLLALSIATSLNPWQTASVFPDVVTGYEYNSALISVIKALSVMKPFALTNGVRVPLPKHFGVVVGGVPTKRLVLARGQAAVACRMLSVIVAN